MMDEMGIFRTEVAVENPQRPGELVTVRDVIVDTGSELTWIPSGILISLGLEPRRPVRFVTANGQQVERQVCFANIYVAGTSAAEIVVFGEPGDMTLLGARSLEGLNLRVDPAAKQLVSAGPVLAVVAA